MATSWATIEELYTRFGDEFVDKISTRRVWDCSLDSYVADESKTARRAVVQLALDDAKAFLKYKMACKFSNVDLLETDQFSIVKSWHIKLTIETLKIGGDCTACTECNAAFDSFLDCGKICNSIGVCLSSSKTFLVATEAVFDCECGSNCKCC